MNQTILIAVAAVALVGTNAATYYATASSAAAVTVDVACPEQPAAAAPKPPPKDQGNGTIVGDEIRYDHSNIFTN